jgi:uncharacterized heparinase superfamily protein
LQASSPGAIINRAIGAEHLFRKVMRMRQVQVKRIVKREPTRMDLLPVDPRDADVVRAKRRLYERRARFVRRDR